MIYPTKDCKYDLSVWCGNFHELEANKIDKPLVAEVGQVLVVKAVDEKGFPTEFECINPVGAASEDIINKIIDPDNYPLDVVESEDRVITLEVGKLSRSNGSERDDEGGLRTPDFIPVSAGEKIYPVYEELSSRGTFLFLLYDSSYNFISTKWDNDETNYAYVGSGDCFTIPDNVGVAYLKGYISVEDTTGTLTVKYSLTDTIKAEHKKIYIADHGYSIYGDIVDDETMHKIVIEAEGKDDNTYNIFEVKAPTHNPQESTIALMNWGNGAKQFVDISSMVYEHDNPTVEIVCQTRGGEKLPEFSVRYNDGEGAGRVKKFTVHPDAIPMELTSEGIRVRKNNNFDNDGTEEEFVTVDLAKQTLPAVTEADNDKILKVVDGAWGVGESGGKKTILPEQTISIVYDDYFGMCMWSTEGNASLCTLVDGAAYTVVWNGVEYNCKAEPMTFGELSGIGIGNRIMVAGENTGEPFIFAYIPDYGQNACISTENVEGTHTIEIYQVKSNTLPDVTPDDEGKVLGVVGGSWEIMALAAGGSGGGLQIEELWVNQNTKAEFEPQTITFGKTYKMYYIEFTYDNSKTISETSGGTCGELFIANGFNHSLYTFSYSGDETYQKEEGGFGFKTTCHYATRSVRVNANSVEFAASAYAKFGNTYDVSFVDNSKIIPYKIWGIA